MQTTLLGLGVAIILALVAALVGPHFVEWGKYRTVFETNASRLVGMPVRINGSIDVRLLPTPSVALGDIAVGAGASDTDTHMTARELAIELSLGPLLRGEWRAAELRVVQPEFAIDLDQSGRLDWTRRRCRGSTRMPPRSTGFPIEGGRAILTDRANRRTVVLDRLWFNGDVRSLAGPFKGEGGFALDGDRYGYRLSTGRFGDDGVKIALSIDPTDRPP